MFEAIKNLFKDDPPPELEGVGTIPSKDVQEGYRAWVILKDGRIGYIDHYKSDGKFGVRPVTDTGHHYPNTSKHWTAEQRLASPEELALTLKDFRAAEEAEIPVMYRA